MEYEDLCIMPGSKERIWVLDVTGYCSISQTVGHDVMYGGSPIHVLDHNTMLHVVLQYLLRNPQGQLLDCTKQPTSDQNQFLVYGCNFWSLSQSILGPQRPIWNGMMSPRGNLQEFPRRHCSTAESIALLPTTEDEMGQSTTKFGNHWGYLYAIRQDCF